MQPHVKLYYIINDKPLQEDITEVDDNVLCLCFIYSKIDIGRGRHFWNDKLRHHNLISACYIIVISAIVAVVT